MSSTSHWQLPSAEEEAPISALARELRLARPAAEILWRRGIRSADRASAFLFPSLDDLIDPFQLKDMDRAVERVSEAIRRKEPVEIHGDYDADGVTSTVILKKALELVGIDASWRIPDRRDGYGMQVHSMDDAAARGIRLIISVDNGIRAGAALRRANELGIDVIVTDHHLPETELPPALAIINPNRHDCNYPNPHLCGAGVAFKLAHALLLRAGWPDPKLKRTIDSFLKLVAIGTVADIVPLAGENRVIVKHGLRGLADVRNPGLRALLNVAGFPPGRVPGATEVGFRIAPAINASGRMALASRAVEMFLTADSSLAESIARDLFQLNQERQASERAIAKEIFDRCLESPPTEEERALVFAGTGWHRGVVGIVASRVVDRFHRPAIVLAIEDGVAQGSGRSIEEFHLLEALESMREIFTRFGGHAHAAGVTLPAEAVEVLRERLRNYALEKLRPEHLRKTVAVDCILRFSEVDDALWSALEQLAPWGMHNPKPLFAARDVKFSGPPQVWKEKHLRVAVRQDNRTMLMKSWNQAEQAAFWRGLARVDVAFEIERDWNGGWDLIARHCRECDL